ncbi:Metallo-hydrolase/oxidoreductase [Epithele typhae]|uniref:Metallo-hydrolase/oxidoreductase n=1 Tax=Epithele typhae TaxID=378194 RepID=UPI002007D524|nr:Metallo-hydrolase/oxidoreductase [Epithele typhae]KAH9931144.1 Metallo-hydrolase/oxidoreductase [Epithele typhae]
MSLFKPSVLSRGARARISARTAASLNPRSVHSAAPTATGRVQPSSSLPTARTLSTSSASSPHARANNIPPAEPWKRHPSQDSHTPVVASFFEKATCTWQYIVSDPATSEAVIIDSVLDYDPASGAIKTATADGLISYVEHNSLKVTRILETHAHADHLTAAQYIKQQLGGNVAICIGKRITQVQEVFGPRYALDSSLFKDAFDVYFQDDEVFNLGSLSCQVWHLPGHTPDHVGYVIGKAVFTGDSIFNPDVGSARADFPGGNVETLYSSMQRLLSMPEDYRLYVGHDYPVDRNHTCFSTVAEQRERNKHVKVGTDAATFIQFRRERDAVLGAPRLLHPSLQVNIRAGRLPPADEHGLICIRTPVKTDLKL